jgi:hypothetical protein
MTPTDAAALLTLAAAYDNRKPDKDAAAAWAAALGNLEAPDCQKAIVAHYRESSDWLMPVHIITRVRAMRVERMKAVLNLAPPADLDGLEDDAHTAAYLAWLRESCRRLADGETLEDAPREVVAPPERVLAAIEETAAVLSRRAHQEAP